MADQEQEPVGYSPYTETDGQRIVCFLLSTLFFTFNSLFQIQHFKQKKNKMQCISV